MPIKTLRLQISKPYNQDNETSPLTWDELGMVLRDLRYQSTRIANLVIQKCYEWEMFSNEYKKQNGVYPARKEHKEKSYFYPILRQVFPDTPAKIINQTARLAEKYWLKERNDVLSLRKSIPSFKLNFPISISNDGYSVIKTKCFYVISAGLRSEGSPRTRYKFIVKTGEKSKSIILECIMNGLYKKGALQIVSDGKEKWYCLIPYKFESKITNRLDPARCMGLYFSPQNFLYWAFNYTLERGKIGREEIRAFQRREYERRKSIQRQGLYCGEGRIGHGRERRLKPVEFLKKKEADFKHTMNHRYARVIVEEAVKHQCATIQIEDILGSNKKTNLLKNWPYFELLQKIVQKAAVYGIRVTEINQESITRRCSACGSMSTSQTPNQDYFVCHNCGYGRLYHCFTCGTDRREPGECLKCGKKTKEIRISLEYNTARNIATTDLEVTT